MLHNRFDNISNGFIFNADFWESRKIKRLTFVNNKDLSVIILMHLRGDMGE